MKRSRKLYFNLLYFVILFLPKTSLAQTFWSEDFGVGCNQGTIANVAAPTATNGSWTITNLVLAGGNGPQSNEWFISASENGNAVGACGSGCGNNQTLHIGSTTPLDNNATYLQTLDATTRKQAESPTINCTGQTGISLSFNYLTDGIVGQDFCEVLYSINNGGAWVSLGNLLTTTTTPCLPQGTWASATYTLPATVDNNANVKVAFLWQNTSVGGLQAISVAIDDVTLFSPLSVTTATSVCSNQSITATLSNTVAGTTSYSWSSIPVGALITGTTALGTTATVNFPAAGVYTLQVDGYVGAVNTYSAIQSVTVLALPTIAVATTPTLQIICTGNTATLNASGATNYTWIAPPTTTLSAGATSSVIVTPPGSTTYTVFGETTGCVSSETVSVNVYATLPLTLAASSFTTCAGVPVTFTVSGGSNYTWTPVSSIDLPNSAIVIATPTVPTIYTVTGDNGDVCLGTATVSITFGSSSGTVVPSSTAVCNNYNTTITAVGATNYTWTGTGIVAPINQSSISVGSGVYNYTTSGIGICPLIGSISIGTLSDLVINVTQSSFTTCVANNFPSPISHPVFLTPSGASTYVWSAYNPSTMSNSLGAIFVRPPVSTSFTVTGNTSVCSGSTTVNVIVIPQFTISVIPKQPIICVGDSLKLQISNIGTLAALPIQNYEWMDPFPISIDNPFNPTVTIFPTISSTYSVQVFDSKACVSLLRLVPVVVLPQPVTAVSIPTINGIPTNTLCFVGNQTGPEVNLVLTAANTNPAVDGVVPTFTWLPPYQTPFSPILTPSVTTGVTSNVVVSAQQFTSTPWVPQVQTYTVISGFNGIPGCRRVDTVSVLAVDCRSVTIASVHFTTNTQNDTICSRESVTFINQSDTSTGGPQTYEWRFLGGSPATSTLSNPTIYYNLPGVYWVTLKVCNPYKPPLGSCATIAKNAFIKVVDVPNTTISPIYPIIGQLRSDTIVRFGQPITLRAFGAKRYQWDYSSDLSSLTSPTVTVQPFKTSLYIVTGSNSEKCSSKDTVRVIVIEDCGEMFVPTAFSPNGDGNNDILFVRGVCLETLNFMVFNRWGEKVFETTDIEKGWDGTYNGEVLNTGVFVYRLEGKTYDGRGFSAKGNVTLIR